MRKWIVYWVFILLSIRGEGQVLMNRDSLLRLLPQAKKDSNAVLLYINIGQQYESSEPEVSKKYYRMANDLSKKIGYIEGEVKFAANYTYILNLQGRFDSSLLLNQRAILLARKLDNKLPLGKTLFNTGNSYREMGEYEEAIKCYQEGSRIMDLIDNDMIGSQTNDMLQLLYYEMGLYEKAIPFGVESVRQARKAQIPGILASALNNLGMSYTSLGQPLKGRKLFEEALQIGKEVDDLNIELTQMLNLGNVHLFLYEYEQTEPFFKRALFLSRKLGAYPSETISLRGMGLYHLYKKDFEEAKKYFESSLKMATEHDLRADKRKALESISSLMYAVGDMRKAEEYLSLSSAIGDSLVGEKVQKRAVELEKKYENEKKEGRIKQLANENKLQQLQIERRGVFNYVLVGGLVALLTILFLSFRNYKNKQKLQQQRIAELETEKQLTATEAVLKGEEQERTRLARDLHDGLGGMLSGIKFSFLTMKGNLIMTPDNAQAFERSMDMLDSSIKEMRRVAHNMMPEVLVKFGLDAALQDFCHDINHSGALVVNYQSMGMEGIEVEQTTAITIYRVVQELINNTIKHAAATSAIVQVSKVDELISITVEDDGIGFDMSKLQKVKGLGWRNIQSRIDYLKGSLDVQSEPGKGTSVHIELNNLNT